MASYAAFYYDLYRAHVSDVTVQATNWLVDKCTQWLMRYALTAPSSSHNIYLNEVL